MLILLSYPEKDFVFTKVSAVAFGISSAGAGSACATGTTETEAAGGAGGFFQAGLGIFVASMNTFIVSQLLETSLAELGTLRVSFDFFFDG